MRLLPDGDRLEVGACSSSPASERAPRAGTRRTCVVARFAQNFSSFSKTGGGDVSRYWPPITLRPSRPPRGTDLVSTREPAATSEAAASGPSGRNDGQGPLLGWHLFRLVLIFINEASYSIRSKARRPPCRSHPSHHKKGSSGNVGANGPGIALMSVRPDASEKSKRALGIRPEQLWPVAWRLRLSGSASTLRHHGTATRSWYQEHTSPSRSTGLRHPKSRALGRVGTAYAGTEAPTVALPKVSQNLQVSPVGALAAPTRP
jgi:hypothetical protein